MQHVGVPLFVGRVMNEVAMEGDENSYDCVCESNDRRLFSFVLHYVEGNVGG